MICIGRHAGGHTLARKRGKGRERLKPAEPLFFLCRAVWINSYSLGENGKREGVGERGEGTPAIRTPFYLFLRSLASANS